MTRRLLLVLAIGAALVGAPSRVSATSNTLLGAQVTPTSGTTATTFAFTVRYEGRFGATGVAANAGPATVALVRISGTELDGTWRGSSLLPAGTWPVTFVAVTLQGTAPSLAGPTVTVVPDAPATAAPSTSASSPSTGRSTIDSTTPTSGATPTVPPDVAPVAPIASSVPSEATPVPVATAAASGVAAPAGGQATTAPMPTAPGGGAAAGAPEGQPMAAPGASGPSGAPAAGGAAPVASPDASGAPVSGVRDGATDVGNAALSLGLVALALVAIGGSGLFVIAGRRPRSATPNGVDLEDAAATAATAAVERRALRRARMRLDDDPIVAAMGLPEAPSAAERRLRRTEKKNRSG